MRTVTALLPTLAIAAAGLVVTPASAAGGCVGRYEFDEMHRGMSVTRVAEWFDTYGHYIGDSWDNHQKREYVTCWAPDDRRVVVEFSYDDGDSVDWYVRNGDGSRRG